MSGELSYTMGKIAEFGLIEQAQLHSRTSQYGSISRGLRRDNLPHTVRTFDASADQYSEQFGIAHRLRVMLE